MNIESFFKFTYGLYVLTSIKDNKMNGHINNTCIQVTAEPPQFSVCSHKDNLTSEYILESGVFAISIIQQDVDLKFIGHWGFQSGKDINKFKDVNYKIFKSGCPIIMDNSIAFIDCKVVKTIDLGSHMMYIGEVLDADIIKDNTQPLTYDYYRDVIKGLSPKNAPTYIDKSKLAELKRKEEKSNQNKMREYICSVCGYVYNPEEGDPTSNIPPNTSFEDLPDDWVCPICGVSKDMFEKA